MSSVFFLLLKTGYMVKWLMSLVVTKFNGSSRSPRTLGVNIEGGREGTPMSWL